jgi:hypothetical protein
MAVPSVQEIAQGSVAQLVERSTENREVTGSTPVGATVPFPGFYWERDFFLATFARAEKSVLTTIRLDLNRSLSWRWGFSRRLDYIPFSNLSSCRRAASAHRGQRGRMHLVLTDARLQP